jgi:hypothetical protein
MLIFAAILILETNSQKMETNTLIKIDTIAQLDSIAFPDASTIMFSDWTYSKDSIFFYSQKNWLNYSKLSKSNNSEYISDRHEGIARTNKLLPESLLLVSLFFEILIITYLIRNGFSFINNHLKNIVSGRKENYPTEYSQKEYKSNRFLLALSFIIFALFIPIIVNAHNVQFNYTLDLCLFIRYLLYVLIFFLLKNTFYFIIGNTFFNKTLTRQWISGSTTVFSIYALMLSPLLVGIGCGVQISSIFIYAWTICFLITAKFWLLMKSVKIFSIRKYDFLYLILYLCALEILPILLFYKGLFIL